MNRKTSNLILTTGAAALAAAFAMPSQAMVIVDDNFTDGDRTMTGVPDPLDSNWWTSSSSSAIEIAPGALGLVTGGSGRGIRTTFAPQSLAVGETINATYTFTTPDTVGTNRGGAFRVGLYQSLGAAGETDLSASSGSPEPLYDGLPGYMADYDVNLTTTTDANVSIREHNVPPSGATGRLLGTTGDYSSLGSGGDAAGYVFLPNTEYVGTFSVTRTGADTADISSSLSLGSVVLTSHTESDASGIASSFGMLAFHANSSTFGSSSSRGDADNGIDFSNVIIDVVPEPSTAVLGLLGGLMMIKRRSQR